MPKEIKRITKAYDPCLYDSDTGENCVTEKVVDITEDCPKGSKTNRCILLYTQAKRGQIVQIAQPHRGEKYMGTHTHFFVKELEGETAGGIFDLRARQLGLTSVALKSLIEAQAP